MGLFYKNSKKSDASQQRLDRLVQACCASNTAGPDPALSAPCRARIVEAAQHGSPRGALPTLFTPTRQLVVAGALPLLLAAALMIPIDRAIAPAFPADHVLTLQVSKQGDQVHFDIANGARNHYVARSTNPNRFDGPKDVVTEGTYVDRLSGSMNY